MNRYSLVGVLAATAVLQTLWLARRPCTAPAQHAPPPAPSWSPPADIEFDPAKVPAAKESRRGFEKPEGKCGSPSPPQAAPQVSQTAPPAGQVGDLVAVLNETKSVDAFLVTVALLQKMGADARPAVPAVIRNAERLGILKKSALSSGKGKRGEIVNQLLEDLERMAGTSSESAAKGCCCSNSALGAGAGALASQPINKPEGKQKVHTYSSDPSRRIPKLLNDSEDLRQIEEEWDRIWFTDPPSHLTPEKVDGAIQ